VPGAQEQDVALRQPRALRLLGRLDLVGVDEVARPTRPSRATSIVCLLAPNEVTASSTGTPLYIRPL
jgi:hypothetical protein